MGVWGIGALESDDALEIEEIWSEYVEPNLEVWNPDEVYNFFRKVYFHGAIPRNSDSAAVYLIAIAELHFSNKLNLAADLLSELEFALAHSLSAECIQEWNEPKKRKKYLLGLADRYNLDVDRASSAAEKSGELSEFELEIIQLKKWFEEIDEIVEVRKSCRVSVLDKIEEMYPALGKQLDRLYRPDTNHRYKIENELYKYRQMFIAWWLGHILRFEVDEAKKLINYAENNYSPSHKPL